MTALPQCEATSAVTDSALLHHVCDLPPSHDGHRLCGETHGRETTCNHEWPNR